MRKINAAQFLVFFTLFLVALILSIVSVEIVAQQLSVSLSYGAEWVALIIFFVYFYSILEYRLYFSIFPFKTGSVEEGSAEEFHFHVYFLFYLFLFQALTNCRLFPVPLLRFIYISLGARLGENTYCAGTILDPPMTSVGSNTVIGQDALVFSHILEGRHLSYAPVMIGSGVTIGAKSVIMPGVSIGDGAIVSVGAIVRKHTVIGAGEVWMGNPAEKKR